MATIASCKQCHLLCHQSSNLRRRSFVCVPPSHFFRQGGVQGRSNALKLFACAATPSHENPQPPSSSFPQERRAPRRRRSQLPPAWQELSTPVPEPPNYLLIAAGFSLLYVTRHAILGELINWAAIVAALGETVFKIVMRIVKLVLYYVFEAVHTPLAILLTSASWVGLFIRDLYAVIAETTTVWPTLRALLLVTGVLSIGESAKASAVSGQPWAFLVVTLMAVGAVLGVVTPPVFTLLLLLWVVFAIAVQKKDALMACLPVIAVLVAVAEPLMITMAIASCLGLAVHTHWKSLCEQPELALANKDIIMQPTILVVASLALGIAAAARYLSAWQARFLA